MLVRIVRDSSVSSFETSFGTGPVSTSYAYIGIVVTYTETVELMDRDQYGRVTLSTTEKEGRWIEGYSDDDQYPTYPEKRIKEKLLCLLVGVPDEEPEIALSLPDAHVFVTSLYDYIEECAKLDDSLLRVEIDHDKIWERQPGY